MHSLMILTSILLLCLAENANAVLINSEEANDIALEVTRLFRASRAVIANNQVLINDISKGVKGLTPDMVIDDTKNLLGGNFKLADKSTFKGRAQQAMLDAIQETMKKAQSLINQKGKGFKGFIPAVYGKQVAEKFNRIMAGKAFIKLTAPKNYLRNRAQSPDEWENNIIENKFKKAGYEKDSPFIESVVNNGRPAFRILIPEYYSHSCLLCHGEPQGDLDITGAKKEGAKLGDLGGAISFLINYY